MLKDRTLLTLRYLWEESTKENYATCADIMRYLEEHGLKAPSRTTVYKDIKQLKEFGVDIKQYKGTQNHYWVENRVFKTEELQLLIDAVQAAQFISKKVSNNIIDKLSVFVSPGNEEIIDRKLLVESRPKSTNDKIFENVNTLQRAISRKKKVNFQYVDYNQKKKKVYRHEGQVYTVSPFSILWNGENYYMIGWSDNRDIVACFRVDRMDNVYVKDKKAHSKPMGYKESDYYDQIFSMYDGPECEIRLLCRNEMMNTIIDRFGTGVKTEVFDCDWFSAITKVHLSNNFYGWLCALAGKVKLVYPPAAIEQLHELIEKV